MYHLLSVVAEACLMARFHFVLPFLKECNLRIKKKQFNFITSFECWLCLDLTSLVLERSNYDLNRAKK